MGKSLSTKGTTLVPAASAGEYTKGVQDAILFSFVTVVSFVLRKVSIRKR
jgi:hypothetical protein